MCIVCAVDRGFAETTTSKQHLDMKFIWIAALEKGGEEEDDAIYSRYGYTNVNGPDLPFSYKDPQKQQSAGNLQRSGARNIGTERCKRELISRHVRT